MKKILAVILTLVFVFSLTACNSLVAEYSTEKINYDDIKNQNTEAQLPEINNTDSYKKLISKKVDIHYVVQKYFSRYNYGVYTLTDINNDLGIEALRKTEKGTLYSVHEVKQGGLLYIFYWNDAESPDFHGINNWFYVRNSYSSSDFEKLNINQSTIDDFIKVDKGIQIYKNLYNADAESWKKLDYFPVVLYLDDCVLNLDFKERDGKLNLFYKETNNYMLSDPTTPVVVYHNVEILPIDKIK